MTALFFSAWKITSPILWTLLAGLTLKQLKIIGARFIKYTNKAVFLFFLPITLFLSIATKPADQHINFELVFFGVTYTLLSVIGMWYWVRRSHDPEYTGVFVQSAFRGNMGIVGLSLIVGAYGEAGLIQGGFYLGINTIIYNLSAVVLLNTGKKNLVLPIIKNPLIIGAISGIIWSTLGLPIPGLEGFSVSDMVKSVLPIALVSIGGSLSWSSFRSNHIDVLLAASLKLVVLPLLATLIAWAIGFEGMMLGILFLMMASPTAAASYVMAQQMTQYGAFTAETVAVTTLASPLTITLGLILLSWLESIT